MSAPPRTRKSVTRRSALLASAAAGGAAVLPVSAAAASAASAATSAAMRKAARKASPSQARRGAQPSAQASGASSSALPAAALPDVKTRHMLSSFTCGVSAVNVAAVASEGGIDAWFEHQLAPDDIPDQKANATYSWWPTLDLTPSQRFQRYKAGIETGWEMMQSLASWTMMRRLTTTHQVEELMTDFWSNLVHVASPATDVWVWRIEYEKLIRQHALGRFDELLVAAIQHPAMGLFLNNVESTAEAINENLGRELLELHTLGVGNYDEDDVINSARILTGFHVDQGGTWAQTYVPAQHWTGKVKVLSFRSANTNPNGQPLLISYLNFLAHHPATAKRICTRLAVRFMKDKPSKALISSLAKVYTDSNTAIVPVLRALVASNEFQTSIMMKVRTPVEDALATWTAVGAVVAQPHGDQDAANQFINVSKAIGQVVYDWPTPDAFPDLGPAWCNAGRLLGSMRVHWYASSGSWPNEGITFKAPIDWMPQLPAMFSDVVDYVVQNTLFMKATPDMVNAACLATDLDANEMIDSTHPLIKYKFPRFMVSILDTVEHLSR
jgi:uncharacterized protein (DUF1800 family)